MDINDACSYAFLAEGGMAELPSGLLEACVVVGASSDKLRDVYQVLIVFIRTLQQAALLNTTKVQMS